MTDRSQIGLKTFEISNPDFGLSLSMTSVAFIYDISLGSAVTKDIESMIRSKKLWFLPRGHCRLDVHIQSDECDVWQDGFLRFITDTIHQSSVWLQLGLDVQILDIQHQTRDNVPNLYFSIEQPDMSSALLSPPEAHTAQFKGLECIMRFESLVNYMKTCSQYGEWADTELTLPLDQTCPSEAALAERYTCATLEVAEIWGHAAYLVEGALSLTFGTRKRMQGLRVFEPEKAPSLLDLAPAFCNSRYMESIVNHSKQFGTISNILASSLNGQSPGLRRKGAELIAGSATIANQDYTSESEYTPRQLELPIQQMLWNILQDTIKPTIGTRNVSRKTTIPEAELEDRAHEIDEIMVDEASMQLCSLEDMSYSPDESLLWQEDIASDAYQDSVSCNFDVEPSWQGSSDFDLLPWDHDTPHASESQEKLIFSYGEPDTSHVESIEPYSHDLKADPSHIMVNHIMPEYLYSEEDSFRGYGGGMATGDAFHLTGLYEDTIFGDMEENMYGHDDVEGPQAS